MYRCVHRISRPATSPNAHSESVKVLLTVYFSRDDQATASARDSLKVGPLASLPVLDDPGVAAQEGRAHVSGQSIPLSLLYQLTITVLLPGDEVCRINDHTHQERSIRQKTSRRAWHGTISRRLECLRMFSQHESLPGFVYRDEPYRRSKEDHRQRS